MNPIYTFTVPVFIKALGGLRVVLEKSKTHLTETAGNEESFLNARLAPDMFPFVRQVQIATDNAKAATSRLSGKDMPKFEDNETTIDQLMARIDRTTEYLKSISEADFNGADERHVVLPYFPGKHLTGFDYAQGYAVPNFFFHVVTAYGIARQQGVTIGKADYIHGLSLKDGE